MYEFQICGVTVTRCGPWSHALKMSTSYGKNQVFRAF